MQYLLFGKYVYYYLHPFPGTLNAMQTDGPIISTNVDASIRPSVTGESEKHFSSYLEFYFFY